MNRTLVIFKNDFINIAKKKIYKITILSFWIIIIGLLIFIWHELEKFYTKISTETTGYQSKEIILSIFNQVMTQLTAILTFIIIMLPYLFLPGIFAMQNLIKEKSSGILENQLATPLLPVELLFGKSLSYFILAFIVSMSSILIFISGLTIISSFILEQFFFCFPIQVVVTNLLFNQIFFGGVIALSIFLVIVYNSDIASSISFIITFGTMFSLLFGFLLAKISLASWKFSFLIGVLAIIIWLLMLPFLRFFKKENIILFMKRE